MSLLLLLALPVNLLSISVLAYAIYYRRHRRADLMFACIALNIGVFTVAALMMAQEVGLAIAFGLFGVLSIIRLRSDEISQREVGYYFISLALGLVNGIGATMPHMIAAFNVLLLATMYLADHPRLAPGVERRMLVLDTVHGSDEELRANLQRRLDGHILQALVSNVDYVRETTTVDVRFRSQPMSDEEVREELAQAPAGVSDSASSPEPASGEADPGGENEAVFPSDGGTVLARCSDGMAELVWWVPEQGYWIDDVAQGPAPEVEVEFESGEMEYEYKVTCANGEPQASIEVDD